MGFHSAIKQIVGPLAACAPTEVEAIKFHRGNLMQEMKVRAVADLVKIAEGAHRQDARRLSVAPSLGPRSKFPRGDRAGNVSAMPRDPQLLAVVDDDADVRIALVILSVFRIDRPLVGLGPTKGLSDLLKASA